MNDNNTLIHLEGVSKDYALGRVLAPALRDVSLDVERGEFTAITGPSGSGKTTLLNLIGCIDKPTRGRISLEGVDITDTPLYRLAGTRAKTLGFIFQTFNLLPVFTAFENVEYPLLFNGLGKAERRARVAAWLERVGLSAYAHHRPDQLSGGQRQRVAIARAMVGKPSLVLADEPTASLDSHTAGGILDLLEDLNEKTGVTFLFATHDPSVMRRARRRIAMHDGRVAPGLEVVREERQGDRSCVHAS